MKTWKRWTALVLALVMLAAFALPAGAAEAETDLLPYVMRQLRGTKGPSSDTCYLYPYWNAVSATAIRNGNTVILTYGLSKPVAQDNCICVILLLQGSAADVVKQAEPVIMDTWEFPVSRGQTTQLFPMQWSADDWYTPGDYTMVSMVVDANGTPLEQEYYVNELHVVGADVPLSAIELALVDGLAYYPISQVQYPYANPDDAVLCVAPVLYPANTTTRDVFVTSSDPSCVKVWSDGGFFYISGLRVGKADITFQSGNVKKTVCFLFGNVSSVSMVGSNTTLCPGQTGKLTYEVVSDSSMQVQLTWTSSDNSVATVKDGVVTAHAPGRATITLLAGNRSASVQYTVRHHQLTGEAHTTAPTATQPSCIVGHCSLCDAQDARIAVGDAIFTDTVPTAWYAAHVDHLYALGLVNGTGEHTFSPNGVITRAMAMTVLYRLAGSPEAGTSQFNDVLDGKWFSKAVVWAQEAGVVIGYPDGGFHPDTPVTREQLAVILFRYLSAPTGDEAFDWSDSRVNDFPDAPEVSDYARQGVDWAVNNGLISGVATQEQTLLKPSGTASRAQFVTILSRYLDTLT